MRGVASASGGVGRSEPLIGSGLLDDGLPEQAAGSDEDDEDQQGEDVEILESGALWEVTGRVGLRKAHDQTPDHRAGDAPDAADHRGGKAFEPGQKAHEVKDLTEHEAEHDAGGSGERGPDE